MTSRYPRILTITERALAVLTVLNVLYGLGILALLVASFAAPEFIFTALTGRAAKDAGTFIPPMRALMALGLAAVPVTHMLLLRLRGMLASVRAGDPFIAHNARRLNAIAIGLLVLELLRLAVGALVSRTSLATLGMHIGSGFSFTPWVAVLLLFVLAGVFEHGARMRADLEGTI